SLFQEPDGWEIDEITGKISAKGSKFFTPAQITRVNEQYQEKLNEGFTNEEALAEMEERVILESPDFKIRALVSKEMAISYIKEYFDSPKEVGLIGNIDPDLKDTRHKNFWEASNLLEYIYNFPEKDIIFTNGIIHDNKYSCPIEMLHYNKKTKIIKVVSFQSEKTTISIFVTKYIQSLLLKKLLPGHKITFEYGIPSKIEPNKERGKLDLLFTIQQDVSKSKASSVEALEKREIAGLPNINFLINASSKELLSFAEEYDTDRVSQNIAKQIKEVAFFKQKYISLNSFERLIPIKNNFFINQFERLMTDQKSLLDIYSAPLKIVAKKDNLRNFYNEHLITNWEEIKNGSTELPKRKRQVFFDIETINPALTVVPNFSLPHNQIINQTSIKVVDEELKLIDTKDFFYDPRSLNVETIEKIVNDLFNVAIDKDGKLIEDIVYWTYSKFENTQLALLKKLFANFAENNNLSKEEKINIHNNIINKITFIESKLEDLNEIWCAKNDAVEIYQNDEKTPLTNVGLSIKKINKAIKTTPSLKEASEGFKTIDYKDLYFKNGKEALDFAKSLFINEVPPEIIDVCIKDAITYCYFDTSNMCVIMDWLLKEIGEPTIDKTLLDKQDIQKGQGHIEIVSIPDKEVIKKTVKKTKVSL
ncbi:MAG: DUF2779 domain-containing protein, partial [Mycoplasma sp.]